MKENNKISIIVPVYNTENQIRYCLDSIINQTYKNLEIIVVDDGTKDNAGKIAEEYKEKDNRIKVIHQENQGLGAARNTGLNAVTGDYIAFVDSDDVLIHDFYEYLMKLLEEGDYPDIVQASYLRIDEDDIADVDRILSENQLEEKVVKLTNIEALKILYGPELKAYIDCVVVWNKIYKKELFENLRFPVGRLHEDEALTYKILYSAKSIVYSKRLIYGYIQTKTSIMRVGVSQKRIDDLLEAHKESYEFFKERNVSSVEMRVRIRQLENYIELVEKILKAEVGEEQKAQINYLHEEFVKFYKENIEKIKENIEQDEIEEIKTIDSYYKQLGR